MNFRLSEHAVKRLRQRGIEITWIERAITDPARTENDESDPSLAHALIAVPERSFRVLRVIYNETIDPAVVVTAYFDEMVKDL
jgi:hypothetical protein